MGNLWGVGIHANFTGVSTPDSIVQVGTRYGVHTGFRMRYYMPTLVYFDLIPTHPSFMSKTSSNSYSSWPRKS